MPEKLVTPLRDDGDIKADGGKRRYDLIPVEWDENLADVLTYGSLKYNDHNWKQSQYPDRYYAAMVRHINAHRKGEIIDPESGLPHLSHAATCLLMYQTLSDRITDTSKMVVGTMTTEWSPQQDIDVFRAGASAHYTKDADAGF